MSKKNTPADKPDTGNQDPIVYEREDGYIRRSGAVEYKPGHEPDPEPGLGFPTSCDPTKFESFPKPPGHEADASTWGSWIIDFLNRFVAVWPKFAKTLQPLPYDIGVWESDETPTVLVTEAAVLLDKAASAVQRFRDTWSFESSDEANRMSALLRETRDAINDRKYGEVSPKKIRKYLRLLEDAVARSDSPPVREGSPVEEQQTKELPPRAVRAYRAFELAEATMKPTPDTDREAYKWLKENMQEDDCKLPGFETWARYLHTARNYYGTRKHTPRTGRPSGGSVVRADQVELPRKDE